MLEGTCPYYRYDKGNILFCEGATVRYPDKKSKNDHLSCYCCSIENGYKKCTMNAVLEDYYERYYNGEIIDADIFTEKPKKMKRGRKSRLEGGK